jgi:excisionase family DNA binding protein
MRKTIPHPILFPMPSFPPSINDILELGSLLRPSTASQESSIPVEEPRVTGSLTLRQAAKVLGVHHSTVGRWIRDGEGPKALIKSGVRSTYRISAADLERFTNRNSRGEK